MTGPDRDAVARAFRKVSSSYAREDFLHAEIRARLLDRLDLVSLAPETIVDLGSGPPEATLALARRFPRSRLLAIDLVPEILGGPAQRWGRLCADAARLPLQNATADLVTAGMILHWCAEPAAMLAEVRRVLRFPGLFLFSTLGPGTLREFRSAWPKSDAHSHTLAFTDMHDIGDALIGAGFAEPVVEAETLTITYPDIARLVGELRSVGAADLSPRRRRTLTGRHRWAAMSAAYERQRDANGSLPVTVEVIYGQAWSGDPARLRSGPAGETAIPIERLSRRPS
jgi:malonyl-CoA O-methyltransferase